MPLRLALEDAKGDIKVIANDSLVLGAGAHLSGTCIVSIAKEELKNNSQAITIGVYNQTTGEKIDDFKTVFLNR